MLRTTRAAATWKPQLYRHSGRRPFGLLMRAPLWLLTEPALRSAVSTSVPVSQRGAQYLAARCGWDGAATSQPSSGRNNRPSAKLYSASAFCPAVAALTRHAASTQVIGHTTNAEREGQKLFGICVLRDWHRRIENVSPAVLAHPPVLRYLCSAKYP